VERKTNGFYNRRRAMIYYCIKPIEVLVYYNTWKYLKYLINEGEEIDINEVENADGTYNIFINSINKKSSIYTIDIDHFISQAEWREKQINSIIENNMIIEIWEDNIQNEITVIERGNSNKNLLGVAATLIRTIEGEDWNDCMKKHHELMGWEPYKPM
jgi:hypothetical protein